MSTAETPTDPNWAGTTTEGQDTDYWMFARHGRWHIHDAYSGEVLSILPLFNAAPRANSEVKF